MNVFYYPTQFELQDALAGKLQKIVRLVPEYDGAYDMTNPEEIIVETSTGVKRYVYPFAFKRSVLLVREPWSKEGYYRNDFKSSQDIPPGGMPRWLPPGCMPIGMVRHCYLVTDVQATMTPGGARAWNLEVKYVSKGSEPISQ